MGHDVTVADLVERDLAPARMMRADVTDVGAICAVAARARPEVVYHRAAQIDARRSVEDPASGARVNVSGNAAVLEVVRRAGAQRVVLASSAAVHAEARPGECRRSCLASARAALAFGGRARTPLDVGLAATLGGPSSLPGVA